MKTTLEIQLYTVEEKIYFKIIKMDDRLSNRDIPIAGYVTIKDDWYIIRGEGPLSINATDICLYVKKGISHSDKVSYTCCSSEEAEYKCNIFLKSFKSIEATVYDKNMNRIEENL